MAVPIPATQVAGPGLINGGMLAAGTGVAPATQGVIPPVTQNSQTISIAQQQLNRLQNMNQMQNQTTLLKSQTVVPTPQPTPQPAPPAAQQPAPTTTFAGLDPNRQVPIQITLPPQTGVLDAQQRVLTIHVPASALTGKKNNFQGSFF